jgi:hypothetical protein
LEGRHLPSGGYIIQAINDPQAGTGFAQGTSPGGMNAAGDMVGVYFDSNTVAHGFIRDHNGVYTSFDEPSADKAMGGTCCYAGGLTSKGNFVGAYLDANGVNQGYARLGGKFVTLDDPDSAHGKGPFPAGTLPFGLNERGDVVGEYFDANGVGHAFLLSHGRYTTIHDPLYPGLPGFPGEGIGAINDSGVMVGGYGDANYNQHGYLLRKDVFTPIDDPNAGTAPFQGTEADGINNEGIIVGNYIDANDVPHGFVLKNGHYTTLDVPGASTLPHYGTQVAGIDVHGQIYGAWFDSAGLEHGFLATPSHDEKGGGKITESIDTFASPLDVGMAAVSIRGSTDSSSMPLRLVVQPSLAAALPSITGVGSGRLQASHESLHSSKMPGAQLAAIDALDQTLAGL